MARLSIHKARRSATPTGYKSANPAERTPHSRPILTYNSGYPGLSLNNLVNAQSNESFQARYISPHDFGGWTPSTRGAVHNSSRHDSRQRMTRTSVVLRKSRMVVEQWTKLFGTRECGNEFT